jgi:hypothetical protein
MNAGINAEEPGLTKDSILEMSWSRNVVENILKIFPSSESQLNNAWYMLFSSQIVNILHKVLPVLNQATKAYGGLYIEPGFLDSTSWRWVVIFKHRPLYSWVKVTRQPPQIGGWVVPRTDIVEVETIIDNTGTRTPTSPSSSSYREVYVTSLLLDPEYNCKKE